jgi:hypothetical protein
LRHDYCATIPEPAETRFHCFVATDAAPEILEQTWMGYALASDTHKFNITEQGRSHCRPLDSAAGRLNSD